MRKNHRLIRDTAKTLQDATFDSGYLRGTQASGGIPQAWGLPPDTAGANSAPSTTLGAPTEHRNHDDTVVIDCAFIFRVRAPRAAAAGRQ